MPSAPFPAARAAPSTSAPHQPPQTDLALLQLMQWLSPAFPLGSFAYSHGLEWAIAQGRIRKGADLLAWMQDLIGFGSGRVDAGLLALALAPGADHGALAALGRALCPGRERQEETESQGAALAATVSALGGAIIAPAPLPVALGQAAAPLGLPMEQVIGLYLQSFATSLVMAAVRFMPLGQTEGQRILAALHPTLLACAARAALVRDSDDLGSAAFGADMAAMAHEQLEVRIFRS